jgi:hypothetical protein
MLRRSHAVLTLLLAGCGGGQSSNQSAAQTGEVALTNASVEDVAAQTAAAGKAGAMRFEPGEWETTVTIDQASLPGMPTAAKSMERLKLAKTTTRNCVTPEQAARPNEAMFGGKGGNCRFDRYAMRGGKLDATMRCTGAGMGGSEAVIAMTGRYAERSFDLVNTMTAAPMPGHPEITMTSRVIGKRLGACKS